MDKVFSLVLPRYKDKILHSLHQLQQKGVNCDVTLQACDGIANIHSIVLAANSDSQLVQKQREIDCTAYSINVVEALVLLLYSGQIIIEEKYFKDFINLLEDLDLKSVTDKVSDQTAFIDNKEVNADKNSSGEEESDLENLSNDTFSLQCQDENIASQCWNRISNFPSLEEDLSSVKIKTVTEGENLYIKINHSFEWENSDKSLGNEISDLPVGRINNFYQDSHEDMHSCKRSNVNDCYSDTLNCKEKDTFEQQLVETIHENLIRNTMTVDDSNDRTVDTGSTSLKIKALEKESLHTNHGDISGRINSKDKKIQSSSSCSDIKNEKIIPSNKRRLKTGKISRSLRKKKKVDIIKESTPKNEDNNGTIDEDSKGDSSTNPNSKKVWKCVKCNVTFPTYSLRSHHMTGVHRPYPCTLCDWVGAQPHRYACHMYGQHKVVIDPKRYPLVECNVEDCSYKCLSIMLWNHMRNHRFKADKFVCDHCGTDFTSPAGLKAHMSHHKEKEMKYKCKECDKVFGWNHELLSHVNIEHTSYKLCDKCPFKTKNKMTLSLHLHNVHGEPLPPKTKVYRCDQCDFYCFYPCYLRIHKQEHSETNNYKCNHCPREFKTKKAWRSHIAVVHVGLRFHCDMCDYSAKTATTLRTHKISSHSQARPFCCEFCEYTCKLKGNLNIHMKNVHKQEKITAYNIRKMMVKTGKGYNEYLEAKRKAECENESSDHSIKTRPINDDGEIREMI